MSEKRLESSELILNKDGTIYHLAVKKEHISDTVIIVGDQGRVGRISKYFDKIEYEIENREFTTHTGFYKNKRLSVMSTGIGTDNIDIFMNELDAVVNINFETRLPYENHTSLNVIRLGTTGAIHEDIEVGSHIISEYGLGFDGLLHFYKHPETWDSSSILEAIKKHLQFNSRLPEPYLASASTTLVKTLGRDMTVGITATAPGFYGPQDRSLRLIPSINALFKKLQSFDYQGYRITNFEMETSALYALGSLLGHQCCTCCVALANRASRSFVDDHGKAVEGLIQVSLERIAEL